MKISYSKKFESLSAFLRLLNHRARARSFLERLSHFFQLTNVVANSALIVSVGRHTVCVITRSGELLNHLSDARLAELIQKSLGREAFALKLAVFCCAIHEVEDECALGFFVFELALVARFWRRTG